jgi:hypothetical protein
LAADKIVLKQYPDVKLGFLNVNFIKQWPDTAERAKKAIDFASEQGFWWTEIRDPFADLTLAQSKELAAYAKQRGIEIAYATNVGILDPNFWEVFSRGVANAAVFVEGPRTIRTGITGVDFAMDPKKTHWTFAEFQKAVRRANQAANLAKMFGLRYVVENGVEAMKGNGVNTFGTDELFWTSASSLPSSPRPRCRTSVSSWISRPPWSRPSRTTRRAWSTCGADSEGKRSSLVGRDITSRVAPGSMARRGTWPSRVSPPRAHAASVKELPFSS